MDAEYYKSYSRSIVATVWHIVPNQNNSKAKHDAALKIKYDYTLTKFKNKILELIPQQQQQDDISWIQTIEELNLSQIQQLIYQHTLSLQQNIYPSQLLTQTQKRSFESILSWGKWLAERHQ